MVSIVALSSLYDQDQQFSYVRFSAHDTVSTDPSSPTASVVITGSPVSLMASGEALTLMVTVIVWAFFALVP